jgi:hypothetical protein
MDQRDLRLRQIWAQKEIPVVYRPAQSKPFMVRLPYSPTNRHWLKGDHRNHPEWLTTSKCWKTPKAWFEDIIKRALEKYGSVYVIHSFNAQQKCAPACWNATGVECECSCMGEHHGSGNPAGKWHIVSETFAVSWDAREYSCRLLVKPAEAL